MLFCISFVTFISFQFCTNIQEIDNRRRCERKKVIESVGYRYEQKNNNKKKKQQQKEEQTTEGLIKARLPLECCWPLCPKEDVLICSVC